MRAVTQLTTSSVSAHIPHTVLWKGGTQLSRSCALLKLVYGVSCGLVAFTYDETEGSHF